MLRRVVVLLLISFVFLPQVFAQNEEPDTHVFGYFQGMFDNMYPRDGVRQTSSFSLQQLNLMVAHKINPSFSAFVNFEVTNNYSTDLNWGSFRLEEAWVRYYYSSLLNVKLGLLVPEFNSLNTIKNKTPLLPYIFRPGVYESSISDLVDLEDFVPQRAFIQVYGSTDVGDATVEYSSFIGNSESQYANSTSGNLVVRGVDSVSWKTIGGRLGVKIAGIKLGTSLTFDKNKLTNSPVTDIPRIRFGSDISIHVNDLTLEGEVISVGHTLTTEQSKLLEAAAVPALGLTGSLNQLFYYGILNYDFNEKAFAYASYNYLHDRNNVYLAEGAHLYSVGGGFRLVPSVVLKGQFYRLRILECPVVLLDEDHVLVAISVNF